ncbi:DoxX family protein [Glycomyces tenuis]|uniref:DoxX family protein n=1 Tax=Glycomyces tenuis TaxID=58116 RepID=UPI0003FDD506|nr:DoxX family protein [Glycomyces tenuis]
MSTAYTIVALFAAAFVAFSAIAIFFNFSFVTDQLSEYGVPRSAWPWLGAAKTAGAIGLVVGLFVPFIGVAAAIGLILYFTGALITVLRARCYSHIGAPLMYMAPVIGALVLGAAA